MSKIITSQVSHKISNQLPRHIRLVRDCLRRLSAAYSPEQKFQLCLQDDRYGLGEEELIAEGLAVHLLPVLAYQLGQEAEQPGWKCHYYLSDPDNLKVVICSETNDQRYYAIRTIR
jgi:hypothetical protein